jgi:hypothetical protein
MFGSFFVTAQNEPLGPFFVNKRTPKGHNQAKVQGFWQQGM